MFEIKHDPLEACPFCGGEAVMMERPLMFPRGNTVGYYVYCKECHCEGPIEVKRDEDPGFAIDGAVVKWNMRTAHSFKCPDCGDNSRLYWRTCDELDYKEGQFYCMICGYRGVMLPMKTEGVKNA